VTLAALMAAGPWRWEPSRRLGVMRAPQRAWIEKALGAGSAAGGRVLGGQSSCSLRFRRGIGRSGPFSWRACSAEKIVEGFHAGAEIFLAINLRCCIISRCSESDINCSRDSQYDRRPSEGELMSDSPPVFWRIVRRLITGPGKITAACL